MAWTRAPGPVAPGLTIGLLGGSFDPAHEGHLHVSLTALNALHLDYVWWLVSPGNPLKPAPADLAWRMAGARAVGRHPRILVTDVERALATRYTVDAVAALQRRFSQVRFVWLMGSDNLAGFHHWRNWQVLAQMLPIVVVRRPGSVLATLNAPLARRFGVGTRLGPPPSLLVLDGHRCPRSSTTLRELAGLGAPMDAMLNPLL